jgi:hypothetical protein
LQDRDRDDRPAGQPEIEGMSVGRVGFLLHGGGPLGRIREAKPAVWLVRADDACG